MHYNFGFLGVRDQHNYDTVAQLYVAHVMKKQTGSCIGVKVNFTEELLKKGWETNWSWFWSWVANYRKRYVKCQTVVAASRRKVTVEVGDDIDILATITILCRKGCMWHFLLSRTKAVIKTEPCMISQAVPSCTWVKSLST